MDKEQAAAIAEACLDRLRTIGYAELKRRADEGVIDTEEVTKDGHDYQLEIQYLIDDPRTLDIRVSVGVDDGGWSAFAPLCRDFIKAPNGRFVGE